MQDKENPYQVVVERWAKEPLEALAHDLGFLWGDRGNVRGLVEAIARKEIPLGGVVLSSRIQAALIQAIQALNRESSFTTIQELAPLVKELSPDLSPNPIIQELLTFIHQAQPFQLGYGDAAGRTWQYSVRFAKLAFHERRHYLDCWCEEIDGNQDIPELMHNWCLRLDRIQPSIAPLGGVWHEDLDAVEVLMHLFGGLAHAYESRPEDISVNWLKGSDAPVLVVHRRVANSFWFLREIIRYGADCEILQPVVLRERLKATLSGALNRYEV